MFDLLQVESLETTYYYIRLVSFWVAIITFWILAYKYVWNNWIWKAMGESHELNWAAVGMWAGTFGYTIGLGEIVYTQPDLSGGLRVWFIPVVVFLWCYIALFKIPTEKNPSA